MKKNILHIVYIVTNRAVLTGCIFLALVMNAGNVAAQNETNIYQLNFDKVKVGQLPAGWKAAATNPEGPLAQWAVAEDVSNSKHEKILSIIRIEDGSTGVFNLNWTNQLVFQNGDISVRMRANSGKEDQGGGIIWRVQDENNYYVARYNPLESNFRLYYVEDGLRTMLISSDHLISKAGVWVEIKIRHQGQHIQGWFNNILAWEINDAHLPKAGGIGLWTKADAASSFADLLVTSAPLDALGKLKK